MRNRDPNQEPLYGVVVRAILRQLGVLMAHLDKELERFNSADSHSIS